MRGASFALAATSALVSVSDAASTEEWKSRSIYQIVVDRFAKTDGSTTDACDDLSQFCNGTWAGLISQLDYIQGKPFPISSAIHVRGSGEKRVLC